MKKIWSIRKEKEGVSPVIATILMVAITVVLAAVLYVMVIQFNGPPSLPPTLSWNDVGAQSTTEGKLVFGPFSYDVSPIQIRMYIKANGSDAGIITIPSNTAPSPQSLTWTNAPNGASARYNDYNPTGAKINQGDYIELDGLSSGTTYSFELYHTVTEGLITGSATGFSTP